MPKIRYRCDRCGRPCWFTRVLFGHDTICENCGGTLVRTRSTFWRTALVIAATAAVCAGVWIASEWPFGNSPRDPATDLWAEAARSQQAHERLKARQQIDTLRAAKAEGFVSGQTFRACGVEWKTVRVTQQQELLSLYIDVLSPPRPNEELLRNFLESQQPKAERLGESLLKVCVRVYHSPEYHAADFPTAHLIAGSRQKSSISINPFIVRGLSAPRVQKFGLSHEARQQIYATVSPLENRLAKEEQGRLSELLAVLAAAETDEERRLVLADHNAWADARYDTEMNELAKVLGLTREQLDAIALEGFENGWLY